MDDEVSRLRAEARRLAHGKPRSQIRYPEGFRRAAVHLARRRLGPSLSVARLARGLGVSEPTLTKWLHPRTGAGLRPVAVVAAAPPAGTAVSGAVLVTPHGLRVEGLDRDTLIAILRALA
jgi:transposase-like protein